MHSSLQRGSLLIAHPFLQDSAFKKSVIVICEHDTEKGSLGFVINQKASALQHILVANTLEINYPEQPLDVFVGGPVGLNSLHFIHQYPDLFPDSIAIAENAFWSNNGEAMLYLVKSRLIDLQKMKFILGYSGWDAEQLRNELNEYTWVLGKATTQLVMSKVTNHLWGQALTQLGPEYAMLQYFPEDPQLN